MHAGKSWPDVKFVYFRNLQIGLFYNFSYQLTFIWRFKRGSMPRMLRRDISLSLAIRSANTDSYALVRVKLNICFDMQWLYETSLFWESE